jgi:hypothetical protein
MNFEGQNINLQDALFVDNITGKVGTAYLPSMVWLLESRYRY